MKKVNILSLRDIIINLPEEHVDKYLNGLGSSLKKGEKEDMEKFVKELIKISNNIAIFDSYFMSYSIPQIGKEFDLLRFGEKKIINIEIKKEASKDKIFTQLEKNKYYLDFLGKEVECFTYVSRSNSLYHLNSKSKIEISSFEFLTSYLEMQKIFFIQNINELFNPSNYLVSPFNSTNDFIKGRYFLTTHQDDIKKEILKLEFQNKSKFISIYGAAGTGKTLLTYDLAKELIDKGCRVAIFHCGQLNEGQKVLKKNHSWHLFSVKEIDYYIKDKKLMEYDVIIFDEVQRMRVYQLKDSLDMIKNGKILCIFSYDSKQCLSKIEIKNNTPELIKTEVNPKVYGLTERIRTNKEIASFTKNIFNLSKKNPVQIYSNIEITFFSEVNTSKRYMNHLKNKGWKIVNFTSSQYHKEPFDNYKIYTEENAHHVIGQEFEKVAVVLDEYFSYNKNGNLIYKKPTYYHSTKMFYQIITRTRKKLHLIIVNNHKMLDACIDILSKK